MKCPKCGMNTGSRLDLHYEHIMRTHPDYWKWMKSQKHK